MSPEDLVRVRHMLQAGEDALAFVRDRRREDLDEDRQLLFAVMHAVQIVLEAAARIQPETRASVSDVAWRDMIGMRNRIVHSYFDIDLDILWKTVTEALPPLLAVLRPLVEDR